MGRYSDSLRAGWSGDRIPVWARLSTPVQTGLGAHPASYTSGTGSFAGVKRSGRGVDHLPPSNPEVKKRVELYLYSPFGPSWPVLGWTLPLPHLLRFKLTDFMYLAVFIPHYSDVWLSWIIGSWLHYRLNYFMACSLIQAPILLEDDHLLVNDTMQSVRYLPAFPTVILPPFSNLNIEAVLSFVLHHETLKSCINST